MNEIKQELLELGFDVDSIGIVYWLDAIEYMKNNMLIWDMTDVYEYIANKYNSTYYKVERSLRFAIAPAKENIQNKYGYYGKIKNSTFLNLIRFMLI